MSNDSNELEFNHTGHRELYDWWCNNPEKGKYTWPGWVNNGGDYFSESWCFACDYAADYCRKNGLYLIHQCSDGCPLVVNAEKEVLERSCLAGLYSKLVIAQKKKFYTEASRIMKIIRDLPVKEGVKCF